jgi:transcriptional regulator with XRE-family HTH domain
MKQTTITMTTENDKNEKSRAVPTGQKYRSVAHLMDGEGVSEGVRSAVKKNLAQTSVVTQLAELRHAAGITQDDMGKRLNLGQSAISKLESGLDDELTLGQISGYIKATGERIGLFFGKPLSHEQAIKMHAFGLKAHLEALAALANEDEKMQTAVNAFFGEAFFNFLSIFAVCKQQLPVGESDFELTMQVVRDEPLSTSTMLPGRRQSTLLV